jgi:acid phosphatase type 7
MAFRSAPPIVVSFSALTIIIGLLIVRSGWSPSTTIPTCPSAVGFADSIVSVCQSAPPTADAYVDESRKEGEFGQSRELLAGDSSTLRTYVKFDVSQTVGEVRRMTLWLHATRGSGLDIEVYGVEDGDWNETGVTYSSAPNISGRSVRAPSGISNGTWTAIDVTPLASGKPVLSFAISSPDAGVIHFGSRESGNAGPRLVVEVDPVLVAAGDIAHCVYNRRGAGVTADIIQSLPGVVAAIGDLAYDNGSPGEFQECFEPTWGKFKQRIMPALGNHEYGLGVATGYFDYFGDVAGVPERGYYSYNLGTWHVVVINSNCRFIGGCAVGSPQERWLREDLAAHPAMCTMAYWHHPLVSSGFEGSSPVMQPLWQALYEAGAELVLTGHDHDYERFAPMAADGSLDAQAGIRQFIVGTGGAPLSAFKQTQPNSEVRATDLNGVLKVTLRAGSYDWEFLPEQGKNFRDAGSATCH